MARHPIPGVIKAVLLDSGGVLNVPNMAKVAGDYGIESTVSEMLGAFAEANDRPGTPELEADRYRWQWEGFLELLGYDATEERFRPLLVTPSGPGAGPWFPTAPAPGAKEALGQVVSMIGTVVIVSNNVYGTVASELREARICQVGDGEGVPVAAIVDSAVVGIEKPDTRIFRIALEAADASPDEAIHIGDSAWADMEGARRAGIAGVHISRPNSCDDDSHFHAGDLPDAVHRLLDRDEITSWQ